MKIRLALPADEGGVAAVDRAVIGSDERRGELRGYIGQGMCILCEIGGAVAGYAVLSHHFFHNGFIELLIVHPDFRRRGIGTALLRGCRELCRTEKLFTSTNQSNLPMRSLLRREGYLYCGSIDHLDEGDPERVYLAPDGETIRTSRSKTEK